MAVAADRSDFFVTVDRNWRWIAGLILGIGTLIFAGGLMLGQGSLRLVLYGERTEGEVTEVRREGDMYAPVVRFRLTGEEWHEVKDLGTGAPDFAAGDRVTVLYSPDDPDDFRIATFDRLWLSAIMVTGFGCFWLMFGAVAWGLSRDADLFVMGERTFSAIALVAAITGLFAIWNAASLYVDGTRTVGRVTEIRQSRSTEQEEVVLSNGRTVQRDVERISYAPVVQFKTGEGREIEFLGLGGSGASLSAGDRVTVIYHPADPIRARIVSFLDLWLPSVVAWGVAVIFGAAVWLSRYMRLRRPASQGIS